MWDTLLEWVKALGVGGLVGVFVGAYLTRRAQDRLFARQQAAQRIERARAIYQDAEVTGYKLADLLMPHKNQLLIGATSLERISSVPSLCDDLMAAQIKLESEGAPDVARELKYVRASAHGMYDRVAETIDYISWAKELPSQEHAWHTKRWEQLCSALDQGGTYWTYWLERQEAATPARRTSLPWRRG